MLTLYHRSKFSILIQQVEMCEMVFGRVLEKSWVDIKYVLLCFNMQVASVDSCNADRFCGQCFNSSNNGKIAPSDKAVLIKPSQNTINH